jgi:hypothetical protein
LLALPILSVEISAQSFTEKASTGLPPLGQGSVAVGDINNDGKLDIVMSGQVSATGDTTRVFFGNGDGTFTESAFNNGSGAGGAINIPGMAQSSLALGDYDKDGNLDLLLTGYSPTTRLSTTKLYHNTGSPNYQFVENASVSFIAVHQADARFFDYNNDGWPDIILSGSVANNTSGPGGSITKGANVYKNNGDGTFTSITSPLVGSQYSCNVPVDFNNDGYKDIIQLGYPALDKYIKNNGDGTFTDIARNGVLPNLKNDQGINLTFVDYNNDGVVEPIYWAGSTTTGFTLLSVNASTFVTAAGPTLTWSPALPTGIAGVSTPMSIAWADYDNDGIQDMILTSINGPASTLYRQAPIGTFTAVTDFTLPGVRLGNVIWGDFNGDNKVDILIVGCTNTTDTYTGVSKVFLNTATLTNAQNKAVAPSGILVTPADISATLTWNKTTDNAGGATETPNLGLTYNLRVGTTPGGSEIINPQISSNGNLKIPALGNIRAPLSGTTVSYILKNLNLGTYYWSVQAVDYGLLGGDWSTEATFIIADITDLPATQAVMTATPATLSTANPTQLTLNWTNGSGYKTVVFMKAGNSSSDVAAPVSNTYYNPNTVFGSGDQIGTSGWYCVFNNSVTPLATSSINITSLTPTVSYQFMVISYNAKLDRSLINYQTSTSTNNPIVISNVDYVVPTNTVTLLTVSTNASGVSVGVTPSQSVAAAYNCVVFIKQGSNATEDVPLVTNSTYSGNLDFGLGSQVSTSGWYCVYNGLSSYKGSGAFNPFSNFTNLLPNTSYQIRACTYNGIAGYEKYSATAGVLVTTAIATPTTQASAITVSAITATSVNLSWTNGNGIKRVVFATTGSTAVPTLTDGVDYNAGALIGEWTCIYNGSANSYAYSGLISGTGYNVVVYEYNGITALEKYYQAAATNNPKTFTTTPAGPVAVTASAVTATSFSANWNSSFGVTGYRLDVSAASDFSTLLTGFADKDVLNVTSYSVSGLTTNTPYYYRVRAYNGTGASANSNVITATPIASTLLPQDITFTLPTDKIFSNAPFDIIYTGGVSGNPVVFTSSNAQIATVSGNTVTIVGAGTCDIRATQAGNSNYSDATPVIQSLTIGKAPQIISFDPLPAKTYGDAPFTINASVVSGLPIKFVSADTLVAKVSGNTITIVKPGTVKITSSQGGNANYLAAKDSAQTLTISKKPQTLTFDAVPAMKTGDANYQLSSTSSSGLKVTYSCSDISIATIEGDATHDYIHIFGAGTATITAHQLGNDFYEAATPVEQTLTVTRASDVDELVADGDVKIYPVPVADKLTVAFGKLLPKTSVSVYSYTGQLMSVTNVNSTSTELDMSKLSPGLYILKVMSPQGVIVKQVVKQ